ncbi:MAG: response regulator [Alphaproteobacteria bacterium]
MAVDDDENLQTVISQYLEDDGYKVINAGTISTALDKSSSMNFDVVLLDLTLPDGEGMSLIPQMRAKTRAPIIVVSGKSDTMEKIICLEMGADDYITKPFEMRELSARMKAVMRRRQSQDTPAESDRAGKPEQIVFMDWRLDRTQYQLYDAKNESTDLTTGEFKLLEAMVLSPNRALSREHLFELTRDGEFDSFDRAIDIQVARLRKKLKDDTKSPKIIKTVRGIGYMFCGETKAA